MADRMSNGDDDDSNNFIKECCYTTDCHHDDKESCETDFVVIGVGTAGALLAKRLSDIFRTNGRRFGVVGLEWGEYRNGDDEVNILSTPDNPFAFLAPSSFPKWADDLTNPPDFGISGIQTHYQMGRMLGGSGNHNFAYAVYPSSRLLNEDWVPVGGSAWSHSNFTEVTKSIETYTGSTTTGRGTNGPIDVLQTFPDTDSNSFGNIFFNGLQNNLPFPDNNTQIVEDYNLGNDTFINNSPQFYERLGGTTYFRSSTGLDYTNTSVLSSQGYGVNGRKLRVLFGALADKILFLHGNVVAVRYTLYGETKTVYARKRIILTAGGITSAAILQRSGVGPADLLTSLGIGVVYDNPDVGQNLQDHFGGTYIVASNLTASSGFLTQHSYLSILPEVNGRRLMQSLLSPLLSGTGNAALDQILGLRSLPEGWNPYSIFNAVMITASRGSVNITTQEPATQPTITSNFFSDSSNRDLRATIKVLRVLHDNMLALQSAHPHSFQQLYPPESAFQSDEDLSLYIQGLPFIHQHWSGSCAIGKVVDGNLNVIGVPGITIADASVAPVINDGNTASMTMFIAENAARFIINEFRNS